MNLEHSFFISDQNISGDRFVLDRTESIHAIRVLRLKINEELFLFDGLGTAYKAKIDNLSYNKVEGLSEVWSVVLLILSLIDCGRGDFF